MITLKQNATGVLKECPTGFSFTTFLFGPLVPLVRGDIKWAGIYVGAALLAGVICEGAGVPEFAGILGFGLNGFFSFEYNKLFIKEKLAQGYEPANEDSRNYLIGNKIIQQTESN